MKSGFLEKLLDRIQRVQPGDVQHYLVDLAREKGFLETIFNAILEGVIVTDTRGRILYLNRAACAFFGIDAATCPGRKVGEIVPGLDLKELESGSNEIINREMEVFYPQNRLLNFYAVSLMGGAGDKEVEGRAIILRDITSTRKSTEETIESERFSALQLLAAGVAHEIGNPLNSLDIHLQLMQKKLAKLPQRGRQNLEESVNIARQEVTRLDQIITQFLSAIRPQPLEIRPVNLNQLIGEALEFLSGEIHDRDVLVETELDKSVPPLPLDAGQMKQAFYNIIRNAFQAMNNGGILRVVTSLDDTHAYVSFSDTGGGIGPEQIGRIFEPYHTTKSKGTGLGLMIVQRIVRAHGGEVALQSTPGKGVTVTLRLPRMDRRVRLLGQGENQPPALLEDRKQ